MLFSLVAFYYFLLSCIVFVTVAEVSMIRSTQYIYDKSPKLRIPGTGFDANSHDIKLELKVSGQNPLQVNEDYTIAKDPDGDGLILKLIGNRRWTDLTGRVPPVALILHSVKFSNHDVNLLPEPVIVAQILNYPSIQENNRLVLYNSVSNELRINGTGLIGTKNVDLYFQPPLAKDIAYDDVTPYPMKNDQLILRIRQGFHWRGQVGKLYVIGVDTGGGVVMVNGENGLQVAEVKDNLDDKDIVVDASANKQLLYADDSNLFLFGTGFSHIGNVLSFSNGLAGNGVNYTIDNNTPNFISLKLVQGSYWNKNFENLPAPLSLLAVNAGQGFVAVGPTKTLKGQDVAMIFERPVILSNLQKIPRTRTRSFLIHGTGFPTSTTKFKSSLKFEPALEENIDYTLRVIDRTTLEITLMENKAWRSEAGPLYVIGVNTRGDEKGWIDYTSKKVIVAQVIEDRIYYLRSSTQNIIDSVGGIKVVPIEVPSDQVIQDNKKLDDYVSTDTSLIEDTSNGNQKTEDHQSNLNLSNDIIPLNNQLHELTNNILLYFEKLESLQSKYSNNNQQPSQSTFHGQLINHLQERIQETYTIYSILKSKLNILINSST